VVLADVTSSLNPAESRSVAALTASILDVLPVGAAYRVYPIHMDMERPSLIVEGAVPSVADVWTNPEVATARKDFLDRAIRQQYLEVNAPSVALDKRTCILDGLSFVESLFRNPEYENTPKQLYIVSDMIEECSMTPLGVEVDLHHRTVRKELDFAGSFPTGPDWSSVAVALIVPSNSLPAAKIQERPRLQDLKFFWARVLSRWLVPNEHLVWGLGNVPRLPIIPTTVGR
jgi:hypothetical protein